MSFSCSTQSFFNIFVAPLVELWRAISKPRPQGRRNLILLQIVSYAAFWTIGGDTSLRYVYMLKRFPGFNGTSFSHLILFFNIKDIVALLFIMPIVSQKLQIHEALLSTIALIGQSLGYFFAPFATELWQFYLCHVRSSPFNFSNNKKVFVPFSVCGSCHSVNTRWPEHSWANASKKTNWAKSLVGWPLWLHSSLSRQIQVRIKHHVYMEC